jgi:N-acylneuraminate cytidylyltransferase
MNPYIVACIFARGGSKGVLRKNIRLLAGKPLIAYSIEVALECELIDEVIVSTDDPDIAEISRQYGAKTPFMRPSELAGDTSPVLHSWQHAIQMLNARRDHRKIDVFVALPPTSPLRNVDDIRTCIKTFSRNDSDVVITVKEADRNPYFNMVSIDKDGYANLVIPPNDGYRFTRRQDAPVVYDVTTVAYVACPDYIMKTEHIFRGKLKTVLIPRERALDIDTELDFKIAECLLKQRNTS